MLPITSLLRIPTVAPARAKLGRMSKRSSIRREPRFLGSFRNFAYRQQALGSFRKSLPSALRLPISVYEISEIGLTEHESRSFRSSDGRLSKRAAAAQLATYWAEPAGARRLFVINFPQRSQPMWTWLVALWNRIVRGERTAPTVYHRSNLHGRHR
jgi:hypothetical protein